MLDSMRARYRDQESKKKAEKLDTHFQQSFLRGAIFIGLSFVVAIGFGHSLLASVTLVLGLGFSIGLMVWHFYYKNSETNNPKNDVVDLLTIPESQLPVKSGDPLEHKRHRRGKLLFLARHSNSEASLTKEDEIKCNKK